MDGLDNYSILDIFDQLHFDELLNMADTCVRFRQLITAQYMIPKYHIHENIVRIASPTIGPATSEKVHISSFNLALKFFRNFGHLITKLEFIDYDYTDKEATTIIQYIEKFSSASLKQMRGGCGLLTKASGTFDNVTVVDITCSDELSEFRFHRIFPRMEFLKLYVDQPLSPDLIAFSCPNLTKFDLHELRNSNDDSFIQNFLVLNPQLETVHLKKVTQFEALNVIRDLPNLKELQIVRRVNDFFKSNETIDLVTVQHFTLDIMCYNLDIIHRFPIRFKHLKSLEINSLSLVAPFVTDLIQQNMGTIKLLSLPLSNLSEIFSMLLTFVRGMVELEEIRLWWSDRITAGELTHLLNDARKLNKVVFSAWNGIHCQDLLNKMPIGWELVNLNGEHEMKYLTFERK